MEGEFDGLSDYSDDTLEHANKAYVAFEERNLEDASIHYKYAAEKRYRYALFYWGLELVKSPETRLEGCNYLLMGAYRGEDDCCNYVERRNPYLMERFDPLDRRDIWIWLRGDWAHCPPPIREIVAQFEFFMLKFLI